MERQQERIQPLDKYSLSMFYANSPDGQARPTSFASAPRSLEQAPMNGTTRNGNGARQDRIIFSPELSENHPSPAPRVSPRPATRERQGGDAFGPDYPMPMLDALDALLYRLQV
jgi:hypothetical protein